MAAGAIFLLMAAVVAVGMGQQWKSLPPSAKVFSVGAVGALAAIGVWSLL